MRNCVLRLMRGSLTKLKRSIKSPHQKKARYQVIREMKDRYPAISLLRFCRLLGVTRQAFYQPQWQNEQASTKGNLIIGEVMRIRQRHPVIGTRKLYLMLEPFLQQH